MQLGDLYKKIVTKFIESNLIKKGVLFTLFATINNGLNFLLIFLLSIYLSKEDFGVLNLYNVLILIVSVLISLGTQSYFGVAFFKNNRRYFIRVLNSILSISVVICLLFGIVIFAFQKPLTNVLGFEAKYQFYGIVLCLLQVFYTINLEVYRFEEKPFYYGILSLIWAICNISFTVLLCIIYKNGWVGRVDAQLISAVFLFIINVVILVKKGYLKFLKPQKIHFTDSLKFGLPLIPHNSTIWIRQGFDRYIINYSYGATLVANYSFAYNLSGIILMIGTAFNSTNSVYIFKTLSSNVNSRNGLKKQIYFMIIMFATITILGYVISYFFIILILPKYRDAINYLLPLFMAAFFQCIYYLFVNYLMYFKKTNTLMYITFTISIFHFILSFILTRYSVLFTTYLSLFSNFLICIFVIYYSNKSIHLFNFKDIKVFNINKK